jgi:hypothetical protein
MFKPIKKIPPLALQLPSGLAFAQTVTVGEADFLLGESAFPIASEFPDPGGCGSEDNGLFDITDPLLRPFHESFILLGTTVVDVAVARRSKVGPWGTAAFYMAVESVHRSAARNEKNAPDRGVA